MAKDRKTGAASRESLSRAASVVVPVTIAPGEIRPVFTNPARGAETCRSICVSSSQEESLDDGGSQTPLGFIDFGVAGSIVHAEFDVRDGVILSVPASTVSVSVRNQNEPGDASIVVSAFQVDGVAKGVNTRSFGIDAESSNFRVPAFADSVMFELAVPNSDYRALVSDSETGDTFGQFGERVVYALHCRARWIRLFNVPSAVGGTVTFFLSI